MNGPGWSKPQKALQQTPLVALGQERCNQGREQPRRRGQATVVPVFAPFCTVSSSSASWGHRAERRSTPSPLFC